MGVGTVMWPVRRAGVGASVAGAIGVTVASFLPWLRSGRVSRNSFEVVRIADHLDLTEGLGQQLAIGVWYLLPALCALVVLTAVLARLGWLVGTGLLVGVVAFVGGMLTVRSPLPAQVGPWIAMLAGTVAIAGALVTWWWLRHDAIGAPAS